jgi:hypothetical protein
MPATRLTHHVLAAAAACASSRGSTAAKHPDTTHHRVRPQSAATHHDDLTISPARASRIIGHSRIHGSRTHQPPANHPPRRPAARNSALGHRSNPPSNGQDCCPATAAICTRSVRHSQIPIAIAASRCPTHRDFVPWRFSAAGCLSTWIGHHSGGRKPAQKQTLEATWQGRLNL